MSGRDEWVPALRGFAATAGMRFDSFLPSTLIPAAAKRRVGTYEATCVTIGVAT